MREHAGSELEILTDSGEVPWDLKIHNGVAYRTSYEGEHYGSGDTSEIAVFFKQSTDGTTWTPVGGRPNVYYGGVSEVAFEFDADGALWAVTRNEDGDASGFGSHASRRARACMAARSRRERSPRIVPACPRNRGSPDSPAFSISTLERIGRV